MEKNSLQYLIVGNSAAGISAAKEIRRQDSRGDVTILSDEPVYGYSRVMLPLYIAGKIPKKAMFLTNRSFYTSLRIRLLRGEFVESIDPKNQRVRTQTGKTVAYDRLLLATGSSPKTMEVPGENLHGVYFLRKIKDAENIREELSASKAPVLVAGGGLVGVKSLEAFLIKKRKVSWVISSDRILSQMLDRTASDLVMKAFERKGVRVHLRMDIKAFLGKERLEGALLSDGSNIPCGLALVGKGVTPNLGSLSGTGIAVNQGVLVNNRMATNLPSVYAAGDVAEPFDVVQRKGTVNALWPMAIEGGRIAGSNMAGGASYFSGAFRMNSMEVLGTRVVSVGEWEGEVARVFQEGDRAYRKLVFSGGRLKGFILIGDIQCAGVLTSFVKNQEEISFPILEESLNRGLSYQPRLHGLEGQIQAVG
jgi:nitrite reductase (NADH) large subunit